MTHPEPQMYIYDPEVVDTLSREVEALGLEMPAERRAAAHIPEDVTFRTKPQIALDLLDQVRGEGLIGLRGRRVCVLASGDPMSYGIGATLVIDHVEAPPALRGTGVTHEVMDGEHAEEGLGVRVFLVPATVAKGLEFDQVVVLEPAAIAAAEPDERTGLRRLYVVLTRAVSGLTVVHAEPLPAQLAGSP